MRRNVLNGLISAIKTLRNAADDKNASLSVYAYAGMHYDGSLIAHGTRINWNGTLKKAAVDVWDTEANNPDNAPSLWEDIEYREGYRIIPEVITVTSAFALGEIGWWGDVKYRSKLEANVYTPEAYPQGWEEAE